MEKNRIDQNLADILGTVYHVEEDDEQQEAAEEPSNEVVVPASTDIVSTQEAPTQQPGSDIEKNVDIDSAYVRSQLYGLIETGNETLESITAIAKESQHPRAYEVIGQLLKTQSDNLDKLLKLQKDKKDLLSTGQGGRSPSDAGSPNVNINNAVVFNGSTADLLKLMKQKTE